MSSNLYVQQLEVLATSIDGMVETFAPPEVGAALMLAEAIVKVLTDRAQSLQMTRDEAFAAVDASVSAAFLAKFGHRL